MTLTHTESEFRTDRYYAISYSPQLRGNAKRYAGHYCGHRVIRPGLTKDGRVSTHVRVAEVIYDDGGLYTGGERSQGVQSWRHAQRLADHRNWLHDHRRARAGKTFLRALDARIREETNEELRRELIERWPGGMDGYLAAQAEIIHSDETGDLVRVAADGDPISAVRVRCPSTGRQYMLRVPPEMASAREGVAWTFGLTADEYSPTFES